MFSSTVQLNVFTYDGDTFTEGKYKNVDEIPPSPTAPNTQMTCMYDREILIRSSIASAYIQGLMSMVYTIMMSYLS